RRATLLDVLLAAKRDAAIAAVAGFHFDANLIDELHGGLGGRGTWRRLRLFCVATTSAHSAGPSTLAHPQNPRWRIVPASAFGSTHLFSSAGQSLFTPSHFS